VEYETLSEYGSFKRIRVGEENGHCLKLYRGHRQINVRKILYTTMDGSSFIILNETPCADPQAGCCGGWGLKTPGYPIRRFSMIFFWQKTRFFLQNFQLMHCL
jgi:hypothetical protein